MDIKRMKKAELIELNGQLNESRIHCDAVIDALRAELQAAELREAEMAMAVERLADLPKDTWANTEHQAFMDLARGAKPRAQAERPVATGSAQAHRVSQRVVRNNKLVHEFDPEVQGSYLAAMRRARELGGVVRRAQQ